MTSTFTTSSAAFSPGPSSPSPKIEKEEAQLHSEHSSSSSDTNDSNTNFLRSTFSIIKTSFSMVLILFSVVVISAAILTKQTVATGENNVHPLLALAVFWLSLFWLSVMEGGLNCMVGLQPIPQHLFKKSHPKTYLCTSSISNENSNSSNNIERFIVGRQYLDLMIVFITSFMVSAIDGASVLGLPRIVNDVFLGSDLAVILCTIVFGQLVAQINCAHSMLDFINNWVMVGSTYVALCVEASGILHAVYFVQILFAKIVDYRNTKAKERSDNNSNTVSNKSSTHTINTAVDSGDSSSEEDSRHNSDDSSSSSLSSATEMDNSNEQHKVQQPLWQTIFFWARVVFSLAISVFAIVVFSTALVNGNTTVREKIPVPVSFLSLLVLLVVGGFMEALQIALFAVKHLPVDQIEANPTAKRNCEYVLGKSDDNSDDNTNNENSRLQAFLVGRQIAQTVIMFTIARIITVEMKVEGDTLFGVSPQIQSVFFDSGLLNALVSTIFASLSWRVTANFFPMLYLGSPLSIWIIRICLLVEGTGVCDAAWTLAKIPARVVGYKNDDEWIGSAAVGPNDNDKDLEAAFRGNASANGTGESHAVTKDRVRSTEEC
uniref:Silicon transporter n=1 Tax=Pseudo-nitzschia australis TaxID=44445 RepID=A0A7S4ARW2_9STRA